MTLEVSPSHSALRSSHAGKARSATSASSHQVQSPSLQCKESELEPAE
jgi:hypothetical protein